MFSLFDPGTARKAGDNQAAIANTLSGTSPYWQAGDMGMAPGGAGNTILQGAANIAATPVVANTGAMDAAAAKQAGIGAIYQGLFDNGGLAEAAQAQAGSADLANASQGGQAGLLNAIANSRQVMGKTSQVGTQERLQNGGAANESAFAVAMAAFAKAQLQAQATHAQYVNQQNSTAIQNFLGNQQIENNQHLYSAASNARTGAGQIDQQVSNANFGAAMSAAKAGFAGGASLGSTLASMSGAASGAADPMLAAQIDQANSLSLTSPQAQLRYATQGTNPFTPGVLTNTYPTTPNSWAIPNTAALHL